MSHQIANIEVPFTPSNRNFHHYWTPFLPSSKTILPAGWQRSPGFRRLPEPIIWEKDIPIAMRDGTVLRGDVFRPLSKDGIPLPALLPWSPYGKTGSGAFTWLGVPKDSLSGLEKFEAPDPAEWCPRGYIVVNVDARGCFDSEGDIFIFGTQEGRDGHDTIEWIAEQPWCDGNVALVGNSWLAITPWFIAAEKPPHLKAIAPWEGLGDFYRESICRGGIPNAMFWELLMKEFNGRSRREDVAAMIERYPLMNAYWEDKRPRLQDIEIPMYILASYSTGLHTEGSLRAWKLRIHPTQEWFDIYQPFANDDLQRFLDHFLLGRDNGWESTPKVRLSLLRYNKPPISFRAEERYPPSRMEYNTFYLDATKEGGSVAGSLQTAPPTEAATTSYQSDLWEDDGVYFTLTFTEPTELIGSSQVKLYISTPSTNDMDIYIIIRKLDRSGTPLLNYNIPWEHQLPNTTPDTIPDENIYKYVGPSGRLRASKRASTTQEPDMLESRKQSQEPTELFFPHDKSEKIRPGGVVELKIPIWAGGIVFEEGETLRLEIKGHDPILPEYPALRKGPRNLNRGRHVVYTGGEFLSALTVPLTRG
ncbi:alpha/beta-hydrolase [Aspergillus sclerotiicarbonarius CBS 121057]|uniref:Alpha/beta-hydrolase n=1 Tax=Aspergillus sclerotiicarbonarius (strain CBS 121057 / IBT 28362) TaxID=1448318 RepID=A0A319EMX0_ASPSB|nr:alpha/beta-hydrolase [Aspergillus sclerotiicarbonarius CBS 121057]